ncbi:MAG: hypothetical protein ACI9UA_000868 [Pseudoalteromonas tetraodonis]|jgi:hypothetical protein
MDCKGSASSATELTCAIELILKHDQPNGSMAFGATVVPKKHLEQRADLMV